jgi:TonB family protein
MKSIIQYQIEVAICMAALSLLYLLLWRKDTNFTFKRFLFLSITALSLAIPLININLKREEKSPAVEYFTYIPCQLDYIYTQAPLLAEPGALDAWEIAFLIFCFGVFIMLVRLMVSYYKIWQIYLNSELSASKEYRLIDDPIQSFSFFNLVMINRSQARSNERDYIISHEKAHSRQRHSFDVLWLETIKMLHWANPFIWLITRESRQNMEYLADQEVARNTQSIENYQFAIVQHASNTGYQLLKSQFSKSNLRNRILMMNQPNNRKVRAGKLIAFLPVLAILFMSFSLKIDNLDIKKEIVKVLPAFDTKSLTTILNIKDESEKETSETKAISQSDEEFFTIVETPPVPAGMNWSTYIDKVSALARYPKEAMENNIEGKIFVQFIVEKGGSLSNLKAVKGIGYGCDEEAIRAIKEGPKWIAGRQAGKEVRVRMIIPLNFGTPYAAAGSVKMENDTSLNEVFTIVEQQPSPSTGDMASYYEVINANLHYPEKAKAQGIKGKVFVQFIVTKDGSLSDVKVIRGIEKECDAEAVRVIKEGPSWIPGKQGGKVVNVRLLMPIPFGMPLGRGNASVRGIILNEEASPISGANIVIKGTTTGTVTDNDGRFLLQIEPKHAEMVIVSVGYISVTERIVEGKNYEITLERIPNSPPPPKVTNQNEGISIRANGENIIDPNKKPLFIVDGVEMEDFDEKSINPEDIENISVSKSESAIEKYGEKGKNGVILIETKNRPNTGNQISNPITIGSVVDGLTDITNPPLIILDGKELPHDELKEIDPHEIESIEVLKEKSASDEYGEEGKYGVIKIKLKKSPSGSIRYNQPDKSTGRKIKGRILEKNGDPIEKAMVNIKGSKGYCTDENGNYEITLHSTQFPKIQAYADGYIFTEQNIANARYKEIVLKAIPYEKIRQVIEENGPTASPKGKFSDSQFTFRNYDIVLEGDKVYTREPEIGGNFEKFGQELGIQFLPDSAAVRLFGENARGGITMIVMR